jgi:hypothetical protein
VQSTALVLERSHGMQPSAERCDVGLAGGFNWSSQHPDEQGCDVGTNSSMGRHEDGPGADAFAGAAAAAA